jgi:VanZ family protein
MAQAQDGSTRSGRGDSMSLMDLRARCLWIVAGWALVLVVIYLSLSPVTIEIGGDESDKSLHVLAYAFLMGWFASIYDDLARRRKFATGFMVMGMALELVQGWTGLRNFEVLDMVANTAGVFAGWALAPPRLPNALWWVERVFWRSEP